MSFLENEKPEIINRLDWIIGLIDDDHLQEAKLRLLKFKEEVNNTRTGEEFDNVCCTIVGELLAGLTDEQKSKFNELQRVFII